MSASTYRNLIAPCIIFFIAALVSCHSIVPDKKTDSITRLAIHYLNTNRPDSFYNLRSEKYRKQVTQALWNSTYKEKTPSLLPLNNVTFITSNDSVSVYKVDGKIPLNCYVRLDKKNQIDKFDFLPYQKDIQPVSMSSDEKRTDAILQEVLKLINHKQADDAYLLMGNQFKSKINPVKWGSFANSVPMLTSHLQPIFVKSNNRVNLYAMGPYQLAFGSLDKDSKCNVLALRLNPGSEVKAKKAATDNKLITPLDRVVDKVVAAYIQTLSNVGISAGVFYKGKSYFYNYGERKKGDNKLPDDHTLYDIGSITKTFTSTLLALAVNEKKVTLETSITKFLPDSVAANSELKNITFKELANHTAGFPRMPGNAALTITDANQPYGNYGIKEMFSFLKHFKQIRQPGAKYEYSNFAVGLLGVLLERIYHKPYPELVRTYITAPLKMNETVTFVDTLKSKDVAQGYGELYEPVPFFYLTSVQSAGIIKSSSFDLITYEKAQLQTSDAALNAAIKLTHQVTLNDGVVVVGLGWHYLPEDTNVLQHGGGTGGFRSGVFVDLSKQIGVVILTNNASTGDVVGRTLIKAIEAIKN